MAAWQQAGGSQWGDPQGRPRPWPVACVGGALCWPHCTPHGHPKSCAGSKSRAVSSARTRTGVGYGVRRQDLSPSAAIAPPPDREQTRHLRCGRTAPEFQGGKTKAVSGGVSQHGIAVPWEFPSPFFKRAPSARWKGTPAAHPGTCPRAQHPEMGGEASSGGCPGIQPGDFGTCRWRCPT